jgi:hypothetical protein
VWWEPWEVIEREHVCMWFDEAAVSAEIWAESSLQAPVPFHLPE